MPPTAPETPASAGKKKSAKAKPGAPAPVEKKSDRPASGNVLTAPASNPDTAVAHNTTASATANAPVISPESGAHLFAEDGQGDDLMQRLKGMLSLKIKVNYGKCIRGSKGDHVNAFLKVQLGEIESLPSDIVTGDGSPAFNFEFSHDFVNDESFIEWLANTKCVIQLYENQGKDKSTILGTAETFIYNLFFSRPNAEETPRVPLSLLQSRPNSSKPSLADKKIAPVHARQVTTLIPVAYANPKLLAADSEPRLEVEFSFSKTIVSAENFDKSNILTMHVGELGGVAFPNEWTANKDDKSSFQLHLRIPTNSESGEGERTVVVPGGTLLKVSNDLAVIYSKKTAQTIALQKDTHLQLLATCLEIETSTLSAGDSAQQQKAELTSTPAAEIDSAHGAGGDGVSASHGLSPRPATAELVGKASQGAPPTDSNEETGADLALPSYKIVWNVSHLVYLPSDANAVLRRILLTKEPLRYEVHKILPGANPAAVNASSGQSLASLTSLIPSAGPYTPASKCPFSLYTTQNPLVISGTLDLSKLYFPNVLGVRIAYGGNVPPNVVYNNPMPPSPPLFLEIFSEQVLFQRKELAPLTKSVRDLIPRQIRSQSSPEEESLGAAGDRFPTLSDRNAQQALYDFKKSVQDACRVLVKEYVQLVKPDSISPKAADNDDAQRDVSAELDRDVLNHKKQFFFKLNQSGLYFSLKEQLKNSVMQLVRDRYARLSPFADDREQQQFLSQLYVDLLNQMHAELNQLLADPSEFVTAQASEKKTDYSSLYEFALLSEAEGRVDAASRYHLERIVKYQSLQAWYSYGCFCLRQQALDRGEECLKQVLSRSSSHIPTLMAYGAFCAIKERYDEARVYLHKVVELRPDYPVAWAALVQFYDLVEDEDRVNTYRERLSRAELEAGSLDSELSEYDCELAAFIEDSSALAPDDPIRSNTYYKLAVFMTHCHAGPFVERAVTQLIIGEYPHQHLYAILARIEKQRQHFSGALSHLQKALQADQRSVGLWAQLGHLHFVNQGSDKALSAYETALDLLNTNTGEAQLPKTQLALIYQRLGSLVLEKAYCGTLASTGHSYLVLPYPLLHCRENRLVEGSAGEAKPDSALVDKALSFLLNACELSTSAQNWLWVGKALLLKGDYDGAETTFAEANFINSRDSEVWAYLALVSLVQNRLYEANQALKQVLKIGLLPEMSILESVGVGFLHRKEPKTALECFKLVASSVKACDSISKWIQVAQEQQSLACNDALANVAGIVAPESRRFFENETLKFSNDGVRNYSHGRATRPASTFERERNPKEKPESTPNRSNALLTT